ncbi:protein late bloomer isoform X2 [Lucilia cuprina]|uniref:protein late bloomer isoform X2 n=1 Tax=Lucilia cuprina TaxID=7375 RepID=UPI001F055B1B|nr:protein late bloomer isoform X2 [Lucilia cuprina]
MSCTTATIKYLVYIFNILCAILGIGAIVVSTKALDNYDEDGRMICIFLIVLGSIVFIISFLGCCGVIRENICLTWTYALCLLLLVIGNAIILFGFITHIDGESEARKEINKAWAKQLNGDDAMYKYQTNLKCCGINNSTDYINANLTIPNSCFVGGDYDKSKIVYSEGCLELLIVLYEAAEHWITIFSWSSFCTEVVAFISACVLAITFRNQQRRARY